MKVYYINILLFAVPLNILANIHKKPSIIPRHIKTTRLLCECELYIPNYDNDPEMKEVMQQFDRQTSQRFREYGKSMIKNRQKCKDQCDKDIEKIILKDKIEKELKEKLARLETNITTEDLPICECEKSLAFKMENTCLGCGGVLGSSIAPSVGLLGTVAIDQWKNAAITAATKYALAKGTAKGAIAGEAAGKNVIIGVLQKIFNIYSFNETPLQSFFKSTLYTDITTIASAIDTEMTTSCDPLSANIGNQVLCRLRVSFNLVANTGESMVDQKTEITKEITKLVLKAKGTADFEAAQVSSETSSNIITKQTALIEAGFDSSTTSIYASIIVILIIVLIMVIIYLILRYRRKKKLKKKLQYIKLLEE
ncbi:PIR protein, putative [Plasmodium sp.]|nr:PIR protein, putative [Plasmodium sp.]